MLPCFDFLVAALQQLLQKADNGLWKPEATLTEAYTAAGYDQLPQRREGVNFTQYSWVLQNPLTCYPNAPCHHRQGDRSCPKEDAWQAGPALVAGKEPAQFDATKPRRQAAKPSSAAAAVQEPAAKPVPPSQEPTTKREPTAAVSAPPVKAPDGGVSTAVPEIPAKQGQPQKQAPIQVVDSKGGQQQPSEEKQQPPEPSSTRPDGPSGRGSSSSGGKITIIGTHDNQDDEDRKVGLLTQIVPWALLICVFGVVAIGFLWRGRANGNVKYSRLGLPRSRPATPVPE